MIELTLSIAKGAMHALSKGNGTEMLENLGILPEELRLVQGDIPWGATQRVIVCRTLDSLIYSTMDTLGLARFEAPAEFIAAALCMYTEPINWMVASRWMEGGSRTMDLADAGRGIGLPVTAAQLFALMLILQNDGEAQLARAQFESRTSHAIKAQKRKGETNEKQTTKST